MSSSATPNASLRRANVVGLGLIGGSIARALSAAGWTVTGIDRASETESRALQAEVITGVGLHPDAEISFVATPVDQVITAVRHTLDATEGWVVDTGSVKGEIAAAIDDSRCVPSHPMAGSEQTGLDGARPDLFRGAVWVLSPTATTDDAGFAFVHDLISNLGADPVTLAPEAHDRMVATVSHVPHLAAATLMNVADDRSDEHLAMLRLAAGGFRDMTRIASGSPDIWPPICVQNAEAITEALDDVIGSLRDLRAAVADGDTSVIAATLHRARRARTNLPIHMDLPAELSEVRVRIKDQSGELAALTGLAAELDVNIFDLEIAHSAEGPTGVIVLVVDTEVADRFRGGLLARGYRPSVRPLT